MRERGRGRERKREEEGKEVKGGEGREGWRQRNIQVERKREEGERERGGVRDYICGIFILFHVSNAWFLTVVESFRVLGPGDRKLVTASSPQQ